MRRYKTSLEDTKFYQNEITNIESKLAALKAASEGDKQNATLMKIAIEALAKTERNFVLKKGETMIGLERQEGKA